MKVQDFSSFKVGCLYTLKPLFDLKVIFLRRKNYDARPNDIFACNVDDIFLCIEKFKRPNNNNITETISLLTNGKVGYIDAYITDVSARSGWKQIVI